MFVLTLVPRLSPTILDPARPKITSTCNGANRTLTMFILDDLSPFVPYVYDTHKLSNRALQTSIIIRQIK